MKKAVGKIKWFNDAKDYGFIIPDDGSESVLAWKWYVLNRDPRILFEDERVKYSIIKNEDGLEARDIFVIQDNDLIPIFDIKENNINGDLIDLSFLNQSVVLVVNTATECGLTPQLLDLERLYKKYKDQGFHILGFPSNDFGDQEPRNNKEIIEFCETKYRVSFTMMTKIIIKENLIFNRLFQETSNLPQWNFSKYLIGRNGSSFQFFHHLASIDDIDNEIIKIL